MWSSGEVGDSVQVHNKLVKNKYAPNGSKCISGLSFALKHLVMLQVCSHLATWERVWIFILVIPQVWIFNQKANFTHDCVRFQLISKTVQIDVLVIFEVEIKVTWQVGSEGRIDGLFEDVMQHRYRLRWNSLSVGVDEQSPDILLGCRSLFSPNQRVVKEVL